MMIPLPPFTIMHQSHRYIPEGVLGFTLLLPPPIDPYLEEEGLAGVEGATGAGAEGGTWKLGFLKEGIGGAPGALKDGMGGTDLTGAGAFGCTGTGLTGAGGALALGGL